MIPVYFNKYLPRPELRRFVKFYYIIEYNGRVPISMDNHPQGGVDILFALKGNVLFNSNLNQATLLSDIFIISQQEDPFKITFNPGTYIFGIAFRAEGCIPYFKFSMAELANKAVKDHDFNIHNLGSILDKLEDVSSSHEKVIFVDNYLISILHKSDYFPTNFLGIFPFIRNQKGIVDMNELTQISGLSERTLQRKFKHILGITPKSYINIIRFNAMLSTLKKMKQPDWQDIVFRFGYYDQAHFIKDFNQYTGVSPTKFFKCDTTLSDFFLKV